METQTIAGVMMTLQKGLDLRFAVGTPGGRHSDVWRVWSWKDEVYTAHRSIAHIDKISFHSSGICRCAFTEAYGTPDGLSDRAAVKWRRVSTAPADCGQASRVLMIAFPTDYLSGPPGLSISKPLTWVPPAPPGKAAVVEMFFTNDTEERVSRDFNKGGARSLLSYWCLPMGETFAISTYVCEDWQNRDIRMPSSLGERRDFVFASTDPPEGTRRLIRLTMFNAPADGDALIGQELGGYAVVPIR